MREPERRDRTSSACVGIHFGLYIIGEYANRTILSFFFFFLSLFLFETGRWFTRAYTRLFIGLLRTLSGAIRADLQHPAISPAERGIVILRLEGAFVRSFFDAMHLYYSITRERKRERERERDHAPILASCDFDKFIN